MPSTKKRINLTVPDEIYERIKAYEIENGLSNDATACLQLIVMQLNAQENNKALFNLFRNITTEQLEQFSKVGSAEMQGISALVKASK